MTYQKFRLEECCVGDWVKCSDACETDTVGNVLVFPDIPEPDLNKWKFERRLLSRIVRVPPPPSVLEGGLDGPLKVETFRVWVRVS